MISFTKPRKYFLLNCLTLITIAGCASTSTNSQTEASQQSAAAENASSSKVENRKNTREDDKPNTQGPMENVTTSLSNEPVFDGSLPSSVLSETMSSLNEIVRREPDNIGIIITYLGLLRLYGKSPDTYMSVQSHGGAKGAKNPWFLLEAGYGALRKKDYGMADFLFSKAEKFNTFPNIKSAVAHARGVRALLMGKTQTGIGLMRIAADSSPAFFPSVMTIGFLALKSGDAIGAERMFRAAVALQAGSFNAKLGLSAALRARGKAKDALAVIEPLYKVLSQDRRVTWNYALVLADLPERNKDAQEVLGKYFQLPNPISEIDNKANILLTKLQRPVQQPAGAKPVQTKSDGGKDGE